MLGLARRANDVALILYRSHRMRAVFAHRPPFSARCVTNIGSVRSTLAITVAVALKVLRRAETHSPPVDLCAQ